MWEELLEECRMLLFYVSLQSTSPDGWQWLPDPIGGYSINYVYYLLTSREHPPVCLDIDLIYINRSCSRFQFLHGGCFVTGCQLKLI